MERPKGISQLLLEDRGRRLKHERVCREVEDVALEPRLLVAPDLVAANRGELPIAVVVLGRPHKVRGQAREHASLSSLVLVVISSIHVVVG